MKLFIDEDAGSSLGKALKAVHQPTQYIGDGNFARGMSDMMWLPVAGEQGCLVLSRNRAILEVESERLLVIRHRVGIVFLPQGSPRQLLTLVLRRWERLEELDQNTPRPFAYRLPFSGRLKMLPIPPVEVFDLAEREASAAPTAAL